MSKLIKCDNCERIDSKSCMKCNDYSGFKPKNVIKTHHTLLITLPIATYNHYAKAGKRKVKPSIEQTLIDVAESEGLNDC